MPERKRSEKKALLRIIDANYNRAKEALRVAEDLARFFMNDKALSRNLKKMRHDLAETLLAYPVSYRQLLAARDSHFDVGKKEWIQDGGKTGDWKSVMTANLKRGQEALRVLEEISKITAPSSVRSFQSMRFDLYELEKNIIQKF